MTYDYLKRTVHMPEKYFRKDRHIKLSKTENLIFAIMWFSKNGIVRIQEIYRRILKTKNVTEYDKINIRKAISRLRKKGIKIKPIYKYGYKLIEKH